MTTERKKPFYRLSVVSGGVVLLVLIALWGEPESSTRRQSMIASSMGRMMQSMHARNARLSDVVVAPGAKAVASSMASYHGNNGDNMQTIHNITTATLVYTLPFIIAGSVFLAIIWFR